MCGCHYCHKPLPKNDSLYPGWKKGSVCPGCQLEIEWLFEGEFLYKPFEYFNWKPNLEAA